MDTTEETWTAGYDAGLAHAAECFRSACVLALLAQGHQDPERVIALTMEYEAFVVDGQLPDDDEEGDDGDEGGDVVPLAVVGGDDVVWTPGRDAQLLQRWRAGMDFRAAWVEIDGLAEAWGLPLEAVGARLAKLIRDDILHGRPPETGGAA